MTDHHADDKQQVVNDNTYRYSTSWIHRLETEVHWRLYWMQQSLMAGLVAPGHHVLEIGLGSGFTANYLRSKGMAVTTIDIDAEKSPDIVANVVTYDFSQQYDHVLAFEVFEHLPFSEFERVVQHIGQYCRGYLFLSVPRSERVWLRCEIFVARLGRRAFEITSPKRKMTTGHHFWEVDNGTVSQRMFDRVFLDAGYSLQRRRKAFSRLFYAFSAPTSSSHDG